MFIGMGAVITIGTQNVGGFQKLWKLNFENRRLDVFDFNPNPLVRQSFWSLIIGMSTYWMWFYCLDQMMLQRYQAARSFKHAKIAVLLNIPGGILLMVLCFISGLVVYAAYSKCDPLSATEVTNVKNANQLIVFFVTEKLSSLKGFTGLFVSSVLSGSLSSVSSVLNSMSSIIWNDFLKHLNFFKNLNDSKKTLTVKFIVVVAGVISTGFAVVLSYSTSENYFCQKNKTKVL
jgi:Na+/proline symporter